MKVLHIITGLGQGGAEGALSRLIRSDGEFHHEVISLIDDGVHGAALRASGIRVHTMDMRRGRPSVSGLFKLARVIKNIRPDIVQTWMCHADLLGGLASRMSGTRAVVWGIRNSLLDDESTALSTKIVVRISALLSSCIPSAIVSCSHEAAQQYIEFGYDSSKTVTIPNGVDLNRFYSDRSSRENIRSELGVEEKECLFGMVARYDPQKDHKNLLSGLRKLASLSERSWKCVLVGREMDSSNTKLLDQLEEMGLTSRVLLAGPRENIPEIMNALDVHVLSSSYGEGFPNVVAEAMACGVPCVATDVGDARRIIGNSGWVVPKKDETALATALAHVLNEVDSRNWKARKEQVQAVIAQNYSLQRMRDSFKAVWLAQVT